MLGAITSISGAGAALGGGLDRPLASGLGGGLSGGASLGAASRLARGCLLAGFGGGPFELPKIYRVLIVSGYAPSHASYYI